MIQLTDEPLQLDEINKVALQREPVELGPNLIEQIRASAEFIEKKARQNEEIYGVTTGFGANRDQFIPLEDTDKLQRRLLISHACGVGEPLDTDIVRTMMLLRVNALATGYSGIRCETLRILIGMLNQQIHPVVPRMGSVGASGDLCPLAHMALPIIGEGKVFYNDQKLDASEAFDRVDLKPVDLTCKEGLALLNGTQAMTAVGLVTLIRSARLLDAADLIGAMTLDAIGGRLQALDERIHQLRGHDGQITSAANIRRHLSNSELADIDEDNLDGKKEYIQDAYSVRCMPQVHGASRDTVEHVKFKLLTEANAVTDNPIVFSESDEDTAIISGGNFHGQPIALALDYLKNGISELASISERRVTKLTDKHHSEGLPAFLVDNPGLNSGFMVPQYVAASLVSDNKSRAFPASVDSIPTSANSEDHVSMGMHSALKAFQIQKNAEYVLGIEYLTAAQALDFRSDYQFGKGTQEAYRQLRERVDFVDEDRLLKPAIEAATNLIRSGQLPTSDG
jgi:histidine ammonia-lyase